MYSMEEDSDSVEVREMSLLRLRRTAYLIRDPGSWKSNWYRDFSLWRLWKRQTMGLVESIIYIALSVGPSDFIELVFEVWYGM